MNEVEQRDMARRLCELSERFDFDLALELVQMRPAEAQELLDMRAEMERRQEERDRGRERLRRALIEDYG
jgi:hypothetical protein